MLVKEKAWDSSFFNLKVGELLLDTDKPTIESIYDRIEGFDLVYLQSEKKIKGLEEEFHEEKVVFEKRVEVLLPLRQKIFEIVEPSGHELDQLYRLAVVSGKYSRYHRDEKFPVSLFKKMYHKWIDNTLNGEVGIKLLATYSASDISGFVTIFQVDPSSWGIGLIAVAEKYQGKGIGTDLLRQVNNLAYEAGVARLQVATQSINLPAIRLYQKDGYTQKLSTLIYHLWK